MLFPSFLRFPLPFALYYHLPLLTTYGIPHLRLMLSSPPTFTLCYSHLTTYVILSTTPMLTPFAQTNLARPPKVRRGVNKASLPSSPTNDYHSTSCSLNLYPPPPPKGEGGGGDRLLGSVQGSVPRALILHRAAHRW